MPTSTQDAKEAARLLPAWFIERMMTDHWRFGLVLATGGVLEVERIEAVHQAADDSIWLDVRLQESSFTSEVSGMPTLLAPSSRTTASVNAAHVVAAFELADT
jgi:hypothetical protein